MHWEENRQLLRDLAYRTKNSFERSTIFHVRWAMKRKHAVRPALVAIAAIARVRDAQAIENAGPRSQLAMPQQGIDHDVSYEKHFLGRNAFPD
jgi:hypothetical protein